MNQSLSQRIMLDCPALLLLSVASVILIKTLLIGTTVWMDGTIPVLQSEDRLPSDAWDNASRQVRSTFQQAMLAVPHHEVSILGSQGLPCNAIHAMQRLAPR